MPLNLYPIMHWLEDKEKAEMQQYALTVCCLKSDAFNNNGLIDHQFYIYLLITKGNGVFEINNKIYSVEKKYFCNYRPYPLI